MIVPCSLEAFVCSQAGLSEKFRGWSRSAVEGKAFKGSPRWPRRVHQRRSTISYVYTRLYHRYTRTRAHTHAHVHRGAVVSLWKLFYVLAVHHIPCRCVYFRTAIQWERGRQDERREQPGAREAISKLASVQSALWKEHQTTRILQRGNLNL